MQARGQTRTHDHAANDAPGPEQERQFKMMRQEEDADMDELVEYDGDDVKATATTKGYVIRTGPGGTSREEEKERTETECAASEEAGR